MMDEYDDIMEAVEVESPTEQLPCVPSENIYDYLYGYADKDNKSKFVIWNHDRSIIASEYIKFKVKSFGEYNDSDNADKNTIKFYIKGDCKQGEVTAVVYKRSVLSICLGIKGSCELFLNGEKVPGAKDKKGNEKNIQIKVDSYNNTARMSKVQQDVKNELMTLYKQLDAEGKSGPVNELLDLFYEKEKKSTEASKKRFEQGKNDGYTDWSGQYAGNTYYERLNNALNGFSRSRLFPVGNAKVSNDTLLVNMTSAAECPSRLNHTCLIGGACYAYADANFRFQIRNRDRMLHLANMICLCSNRMDIMKRLISEYIDSAREMGFPIKTIRLNEAGDFINQQAIDDYARICAEIKKEKGVQATAYTVRTKNALKNGEVEVFNFANAAKKDENGAPAIVLTVSRADDASVSPINPKDEDKYNGEMEPVPAKYNGDECVYINSRDAADRFFMAIPADEFHKLPDTPIAQNGQPNLLQNDHFINEFNPGGWFHKCQCEVDKNRTCGDCHVCYQPNKTGKKYFVLCKLHGTNASDKKSNDLDSKRGFTHDFGNTLVGQNQKSVKLQTWDTEKDQEMRDNANGKWFQNYKGSINRDDKQEKALRKIKLDKPMTFKTVEKAPKDTTPLNQDDVVSMVKECVAHLFDLL